MQTLKIDIVSDVMCPWCIIGYNHLQAALNSVQDKISAELHWHPFQLNPQMGPAGQNLREHIIEKYGISEQDSAANRERIRQLGAAYGFAFNFNDDSRIYNTQDCHVLLHFAGEKGKQTELKLALFKRYFTLQQAMNDREVLLAAIEEVGLSKIEAGIVLNDVDYRAKVKGEEARYKQMGINSVPAFIINDKYLISGGQPPEVFVDALMEIATKG